MKKLPDRSRQAGLKARTITLKIRFSDFKTYTRAITLDQPTDFADILYHNCIKKIKTFPFWEKKDKTVRLLGVKVTNFTELPEEQDLFMNVPAIPSKKKDIYTAMDKIKNKFGERAIRLRNI